MQNESQNQNIDTQEVKQEAPAQTEAPQNNQDIGPQEQSTFEAAEPAQEEGLNPAGNTDLPPADDLFDPDPKVTMNPQDLSGPETAQEPLDFVAGDEIDWDPNIDERIGSGIGWGEPDLTSNGMPE